MTSNITKTQATQLTYTILSTTILYDPKIIDKGQYERVEEVFSACFAVAIVRKAVFELERK